MNNQLKKSKIHDFAFHRGVKIEKVLETMRKNRISV
jgi:hypothetical protein